MNLHIIQNLLTKEYELWLMSSTSSSRIKLDSYDTKSAAQEGAIAFAADMMEQSRQIGGERYISTKDTTLPRQ